MSNVFFSREARNPAYAFLRDLMVQSNGTISIEDCLEKAKLNNFIVDRSHIASARCQFKKYARAASAAGETIQPIAAPAPIAAPIAAPAPAPAPAPIALPASSGEWWEKFIPTVDPTFKFDHINEKVFNTIENLSLRHYSAGKHSVRGRLVGPAGCGKTTAAIQFAARYKRPCFVIDCPTLREPLDLFGTRNVEDMKTVFTESLFVRAIETPRAVVIMDELNRVHPAVMNSALPLWDFRGELNLDLAKRTIKVANGVTFFASVNEGREFVGVEEVDRAVKDRFGIVLPFTYLSVDEEANLLVQRYAIDKNIARNLCEVAKVNRDKYTAGNTYTYAISTRLLEGAAECLSVNSVDDHTSLWSTIINHFPNDGTADSEQKSIVALLKGKGFKV